MKTETNRAQNGRVLKPHDGVTEWSVCGKCGEQIDWASDSLFGRDNYATDDEWEESRDDTSCPNCGHDDTAYLYAT